MCILQCCDAACSSFVKYARHIVSDVYNPYYLDWYILQFANLPFVIDKVELSPAFWNVSGWI